MKNTNLFRRMIFAAAVVGTGLFVSCKEEVKVANTAEGAEEATEETNSARENNSTQENTGAVNPAHGQPGHKCGIPVGAPLNSAPAQNQQPNVNIQTNSNVSPVRVNQDVAVNPPHGQPGHDCSKKVGAPL